MAAPAFPDKQPDQTSKAEVYTPLSFSESKSPPCTYVEDTKGSNTYSKSKEIDPQDGTLINPNGV